MFRAFDFLKAAADANLVPSSDFKELQSGIDAVKEDLEEAKKVLTETIDMVNLSNFRLSILDLQLCLHQRGRLRCSFRV